MQQTSRHNPASDNVWNAEIKFTLAINVERTRTPIIPCEERKCIVYAHTTVMPLL